MFNGFTFTVHRAATPGLFWYAVFSSSGQQLQPFSGLHNGKQTHFLMSRGAKPIKEN